MDRTERTPLRAVIYTRKSNDPSGDAINVGTQAERCRKKAAELGMSVIEPVLTDNDISAYSGKPRPGFRRLLDMLAAREADAVIVWHADRLYRQPRDLEPLVDIIDKTGQKIHAVTHGRLDLSTPTGVMLARILAAVNAEKVAHDIENMKARKETNRTAGVQNGGPRPFGFQKTKPHAPGEKPETQKVDEKEAKLIRAAALDVLARSADPDTGRSQAAICRLWNSKGIRTPRGNDWTVAAFRKMITSARIAGKIEHDGEIIGDAAWPAILDHDIWLAVREVLRDPSRNTNPGDNRELKYLGSGIYDCHCGGIIRSGGSRAGEPQRYRCGTASHTVRVAAPVDDFVERVIIARLSRDDARDLFTTRTVKPVTGPSTAELTARHAALTARLTRLAETFADDDDSDPAEYRIASRKIKEKITGIEGQIAEAAVEAAAASDPGPLASVDLPELVRRHQEDPEDALVWWRETYSLAVRRAITRALVTVTFLPARKGRPKGHVDGQPWFDPEFIDIDWTPRTA